MVTTAAQNRHHVSSKIACLLMLSLFWFLTTYNSAPNVFSHTDVLYVFSYIGVGLIAQAGLVAALGKHWQVNILLGFFAAFNLVSLYLTLNFSFLILGPASKLGIDVAAWLLASLFFSSFAGSKAWRIVLILVTLSLFISASITSLTDHLATRQLPEIPTQGATSSPNVKIVEFQRKPNIYFISWDALAPESLAQELLELPSVPYDDALINQGFVLLRNHFTDNSSTLSSLNQLLAFDSEYFHAMRGYKKQNYIITGHTPGPLLEILKHNGYATHLYHRDFFFGMEKGPYLDWYAVKYSLTACSQFQNLNTIAFFGYCLWLGVPSSEGDEFGSNERATVEFMINQITTRLERNAGPHFVLGYLVSPYHTPVDYDGSPEDYKAYQDFFASSNLKTVDYVNLLVNFLKEKDPDAIIFFFSDHGLITTRGWTRDDLIDDDLLRNYVLDRFGGLAGYYAPDECSQYLEQDDYSTTIQVARGLIQCLAGGEDPFINEPNYQLVETNTETTATLGNSIKDFLYE